MASRGAAPRQASSGGAWRARLDQREQLRGRGALLQGEALGLRNIGTVWHCAGKLGPPATGPGERENRPPLEGTR